MTIGAAALAPLAAHADGWNFGNIGSQIQNWGNGGGHNNGGDNHGRYDGRNNQNEQADRQQNKNTWRDVTIGSGAVAVYGLLSHNSTATLLGALGTAYGADRYEQDRHSQSQQNAYQNWRYDRRGW